MWRRNLCIPGRSACNEGVRVRHVTSRLRRNRQASSSRARARYGSQVDVTKLNSGNVHVCRRESVELDVVIDENSHENVDSSVATRMRVIEDATSRDPEFETVIASLSAFRPKIVKYLSCEDSSHTFGNAPGRVDQAEASIVGLGFLIKERSISAVHRKLFPNNLEFNFGSSTASAHSKLILDVVRHKLPALAAHASKEFFPLCVPLEQCHASLPLETRKKVGELIRIGVQQRALSLSLWKSRVIPLLIGEPGTGWPFELSTTHGDLWSRRRVVRGDDGDLCVAVVHKATRAALKVEIQCGAEDSCGKLINSLALDAPAEAMGTMREVAACFDSASGDGLVPVGIIMSAAIWMCEGPDYDMGDDEEGDNHWWDASSERWVLSRRGVRVFNGEVDYD